MRFWGRRYSLYKRQALIKHGGSHFFDEFIMQMKTKMLGKRNKLQEQNSIAGLA